MSTTPTVADKGAVAAPGRDAAFASHIYAIGPSGPLATTATVTIRLDRPLPAGTPVVAVTRETTSRPWTYLPATLSADGTSATFTTTHFSLFGILWLDLQDLAATFKSDFIDGVTGGLTQTVTKPTCPNESEARGDGYSIASSSTDAIYWCFGIENGTRVLKVTVHRRYPMEIAHPNMDVISDSYNHLPLAALSHLISGNTTIVEPGGTATFNADLPRGGREGISTQMDGAGQSLYALQIGIETLTSILTRFGAGADKTAIQYLDKAVTAHSCAQGIADGTSGALINGCLSPKDILEIYGAKGLLLAPIMAIGAVIAFFHSEWNALIDQFNGHDKYSVLITSPGRSVNFTQIAQGDYRSLLATWYEVAYGGSGLGGPGFQWHQGGIDTLSVTTTEIVNGPIVLRGKTLSDGQGLENAKVVYSNNGKYLTASLADPSVAINYAVDFYPRGVAITNFSLNNGVAVPSSTNRIVVWTSNNTYTEVFSQK